MASPSWTVCSFYPETGNRGRINRSAGRPFAGELVLAPSRRFAARSLSGVLRLDRQQVVDRLALPGLRVLRVGLEVGHVVRLVADPGEPRGDVRECVHIDARLVRDLEVPVQRDVGDRVPAGDEEVVARQMPLRLDHGRVREAKLLLSLRN